MNAGKFSIPCFNTAAFDIKRQFSQHCSHITFLRSKVDLCHFDSNCVLNIMSFPLTIFGNSRFRLKVQIQAK